MKSTTKRTNVTTFIASVSEAEITEALCTILAAENGVTLGADEVRYRGYHRSQDTSTGIAHTWEIEVVVDHEREPGSEEQRSCDISQ